MIYILYLLVFITVIFLVIFVYDVIFAKRLNVKKRLRVYTEDQEVIQDKNTSLKELSINAISLIGNIFDDNKYMKNKRIKLNQAYIHIRVEEFIGISLLSGIIGFVLFYLLTKNILFSIIGLITGYIVPDIIVNSIKNKRKEKLNSQLPEALSILSNGLRAGLSFTQAMSMAIKELDSPISEEFSKVVRDNQLGITLDKALEDFSKRTDDEDIEMLVMALIIQRKVGGNLTEILDTISATIRDRIRIRGEVKTLSAQGKLSGIVISLLPIGVSLMILILNPSYIMELFQNSTGIMLVIGAVIMQIIGMIMMFKMADIDI